MIHSKYILQKQVQSLAMSLEAIWCKRRSVQLISRHKQLWNLLKSYDRTMDKQISQLAPRCE